MTAGTHITHEDLALHAMRSLPEAEAAAVRGHLAECVLCRWQLAEISGDLALLGMASGAMPPPEEVRQRFLAQLARNRAGADATQEREQPLQQQAASEETFESTDDIPAEPSWSAPSEIAPAKGRRRKAWIPWVIAACLAIATTVLAVENAALNDIVHTESTMVTNLAVKASLAQQVLETLTSRRAQRVVLTTGKVANEPAGRITYLPERGGLIFQATDLRPVPPEKTYELWLVPADGKPAMSAGLFRPDAFGTASVVMPHLPADVQAKSFEVSLENVGGAARPTAPILLSGNVPGV